MFPLDVAELESLNQRLRATFEGLLEAYDALAYPVLEFGR